MAPRKTDTLALRLAPEEKAGYRRAAELAGLDVSNWIRLTLRRAAQRELEEAGEPAPFRPKPAAKKKR